MKYSKVKGTYDVLPNESIKWQALEAKLKQIMKLYNYKEIRVPIMEYSEVFHRDADHSDMVTKETYNFKDKGNRNLTLRPEGTAGVVRSYIENKLYVHQDIEKLYYLGPNFRYERPQKGRYRQFSQFGLEVIGTNSPALDAEVIILSYEIIRELGLRGVKVLVNTLGDDSSKQTYRAALVTHLSPVISTLCSDCQERFLKNPLRILDCKIDHDSAAIKTAPVPMDYLSESSKLHFEEVLKHLNAAKISYVISQQLVRGLDYYGDTVFEIEADIDGFGAQNILGGGGRYHSLVKELGGPDLAGIGVAFGMERLLMALESLEVDLIKARYELDAYVIIFDKKLLVDGTKLLYELRRNGIIADMNYASKSFKAQLKRALDENSRYLIFLGEDEFNNNEISVKNVKTEIQETIPRAVIINYLKEKLGE